MSDTNPYTPPQVSRGGAAADLRRALARFAIAFLLFLTFFVAIAIANPLLMYLPYGATPPFSELFAAMVGFGLDATMFLLPVVLIKKKMAFSLRLIIADSAVFTAVALSVVGVLCYLWG